MVYASYEVPMSAQTYISILLKNMVEWKGELTLYVLMHARDINPRYMLIHSLLRSKISKSMYETCRTDCERLIRKDQRMPS